MNSEEKLFAATQLLEELSIGELAGLQGLLNRTFSSRMSNLDETGPYFAQLSQEDTDAIMAQQSSSKTSCIAQLISNTVPEEKLEGVKKGIVHVRSTFSAENTPPTRSK